MIVDGEYNASYIFIKTSSDYSYENDPESNYKLLFENVNYWCSVLGFNQEVQKQIRLRIIANKKNFQKEAFVITLEFIEGYDEGNLIFKNNGTALTCEFYLRRLL